MDNGVFDTTVVVQRPYNVLSQGVFNTTIEVKKQYNNLSQGVFDTTVVVENITGGGSNASQPLSWFKKKILILEDDKFFLFF